MTQSEKITKVDVISDQQTILRALIEADTSKVTLLSGNQNPATGAFHGEYLLPPDINHPGGAYVIAFGRVGRSIFDRTPRVYVSQMVTFNLTIDGRCSLGVDTEGNILRGEARGHYFIDEGVMTGSDGESLSFAGPRVMYGSVEVSHGPDTARSIDGLVTLLNEQAPVPIEAIERY